MGKNFSIDSSKPPKEMKRNVIKKYKNHYEEYFEQKTTDVNNNSKELVTDKSFSNNKSILKRKEKCSRVLFKYQKRTINKTRGSILCRLCSCSFFFEEDRQKHIASMHLNKTFKWETPCTSCRFISCTRLVKGTPAFNRCNFKTNKQIKMRKHLK